MSALAKMIDAAVVSVIEEHPKLFAANSAERARKLVVRRIMKSLTGPQDDEADEPAQPTADQAVAPAAETVKFDDPRAIAYCNLRIVAGAVRPLRIGDSVYLPAEATSECVRAFLELAPRSEWIFVTDRRQLQAWREFFDETLPGVSRRDVVEKRADATGALLPWPWPPSKTGKIYDPSLDGQSADGAPT